LRDIREHCAEIGAKNTSSSRNESTGLGDSLGSLICAFLIHAPAHSTYE
jgi:hypothetical protein